MPRWSKGGEWVNYYLLSKPISCYPLVPRRSCNKEWQQPLPFTFSAGLASVILSAAFFRPSVTAIKYLQYWTYVPMDLNPD
jgi:hypothetical protein